MNTLRSAGSAAQRSPATFTEIVKVMKLAAGAVRPERALPRGRIIPIAAILLIFIFLLLSHGTAFPAEDRLLQLMEQAGRETAEQVAMEEIYSRNNILFCTGTSEAASANNTAAEHMLKGDYSRAAEILESALVRSALFLPFRYNLGICRIHLEELPVALVHLNKALQLLPEYSKTWIQMGHIHERMGRDDLAMQYYKSALGRNPRELEAYTLTGDIYFKRNQLEMAARHYDRSLRENPRYPNGLLGRAKIHFERGEYLKAIIQIKSIDTSGDYDKALHYYYAESAYRLRDYQTAFDQYGELLKHRGDRFFLTHSSFIIHHKMELSRRFIER
ncbi:MAG TPA: tetratricopeptide repeat protein [Spirochaetota bacterium]|nr:tetratricopeptide repeat protein [Spirochaetota bacterium]